ncbi:uridine diphosphate glucose pyrophosphatase NUDT14 isoform X1 [Hypanus sabinus]|uniref:uridine diphosphate glucose pyrophosphatase NUDT14 isoform X1 n=1 Tax=Hypanus sabinus TaxID=79690 RepID=UPI0028C50673|nr:uridine diphosphate glucose pyrophosphatase NUDT14 isoform X1 [Hypanus sabinus]
MESLSEVEIGPCRNSRFLRPLRLHYTQNGVRKEWDFMKTHDSVSVLIYHPMRDSFVLVKQFRPEQAVSGAPDTGDGPNIFADEVLP